MAQYPNRREPILDHFWKAAIALWRVHSISHISQCLKLSYTDLKKRLNLPQPILSSGLSLNSPSPGNKFQLFRLTLKKTGYARQNLLYQPSLMQTHLHLSGRMFSPDDIVWLAQILSSSSQKGICRESLARSFCQYASWYKPDGGLKVGSFQWNTGCKSWRNIFVAG